MSIVDLHNKKDFGSC